ncbi:MAG: sulfotransferase [Flavobacterium sp.]|nr:sulfotransferase [Flavobacterium sp.]
MKFDFLICSERSGSNLITKLLDNHSQYCGPTPPHLLRVFYPVLTKYKDLDKDENWANFINDIDGFFNAKIGIWQAQFSKEELLKIQPRSLAATVNYIYKKEAQIHNKERVFVKEVATYNFFNEISADFSEAKFIWLVRDPRDMALSWSQSPVHRGDIVRAANIWQKNQSETLKLYQQFPDKILWVKYEDLISNQEQELMRICDFLDVDFEEGMVDYHKKKISQENAAQTDNWKNLNQSIIKNNSKKYLKALRKEQIQFIEYVCKNEMEALNYDLEFSIIDNKEFERLSLILQQEERNEKPEYLLISEDEKTKRNIWYKKLLEIQSE